MKRIIKVGLIVIIFILLVIQLVPRDQNQSASKSVNDITTVYKVPGNVQLIFKQSCYDCHSNNTNYPFYAHFQPLRYIMDMHVRNGKEELNFNEFGTYSARKKRSKLRAISTSLDEGSMPLPSYLLIHRAAKQDTATIHSWIRKINDAGDN